MNSFKFKFNGQKLTARFMEDGEVITPKSLQCMKNDIIDKIAAYQLDDVGHVDNPSLEYLSDNPQATSVIANQVRWLTSKCINENNNEYGHDCRVYIEILSPFYTSE